MTHIRLLVVDDEPLFLETLQRIFRRLGMTVRTAGSGEEALRLLDESPADVLIADLIMPGIDGLELLGRVRRRHDPPEVILLTAHGKIESAVEAMRQGAYDYLEKPADLRHLERAVRKAHEKSTLTRENVRLRQLLLRHDPYQELVGDSEAMQGVRDLIARVAPTESTVMILGESGVGKELAARMVHRASPRRDGPFLTLNCGALQGSVLSNELFGHAAGAYTGADQAAPGLIEAAGGGTLFIDEIGEMDADLQKAFLRVLETGEYRRLGETGTRHSDARFLAATNRQLHSDVESGRFRKDLYFRLNVFAITIPPLREHKEDLPALVSTFLRRMEPSRAAPRALSPQALALLHDHDWPGNVRELRNALERGLIMARGATIQSQDLPVLRSPAHLPPEEAPMAQATGPAAAGASSPPELMALDAMEKELILRALEQSGGNKTSAARKLGISLRSLYTKLDRHGLRD